MRLQRRDIYISLAFLLLIFLVEWIEEALVVEGYFKEYLYRQQGLMLRSIIRTGNILIVFVLGYIGLSYLRLTWVKKLWIIWYVIVLVAAGMRMLPVLFFHGNPTLNQIFFWSSFYYWGMSPFPYLFLWMFAVVFLPYLKQAKTETKPR
ncbi:MAG: hypothetical protein J0I41_22470 [Filimonas sp.]|nr:hypothetical protein [Filimonas sp.]